MLVTLNKLLNGKWKFEQLNCLLDKFYKNKNISSLPSFMKNNQMAENHLLCVFEVLDQYDISPKYQDEISKILEEKEPEQWLRAVNDIAVNNTFQKTDRIQSAADLVEELKKGLKDEMERLKQSKEEKEFGDNPRFVTRETDLKRLIDSIESCHLQEKIEKIRNTKLESNMQKGKPISEWNKTDISAWVEEIKPSSFEENSEFLIEALAVIKRANFLAIGFELTDAQLLSCLVMLDSDKDHGRLLQVSTGEGKSAIVSVLAIINALKGKKVDIITSNHVLAARDAIEKAKLYGMFGLSCDDNNDKAIYIKGEKDCYRKNIVYGEAAQFQFDTLRDEYSLLGTLAGRKCQVAIVDEVDSMLIDDGSRIARLSTTMAGMDQLQPVYISLWRELSSVIEKVHKVGDKLYLFYGEVCGEVEGNIEDFLKKHLMRHIEKLIEKNDIKVPDNFKEFVKKQLPKWADNAITAFNYQENVHYVVQEGVIKPVDYNSTGIVQSSTNWSDGLHQFLQIKHNLKMTSETLTTNFLSNFGYFKRYGTHLYGLTGTLGSERARQVLSDIYKVDICKYSEFEEKTI